MQSFRFRDGRRPGVRRRTLKGLPADHVCYIAEIVKYHIGLLRDASIRSPGLRYEGRSQMVMFVLFWFCFVFAIWRELLRTQRPHTSAASCFFFFARMFPMSPRRRVPSRRILRVPRWRRNAGGGRNGNLESLHHPSAPAPPLQVTAAFCLSAAPPPPYAHAGGILQSLVLWGSGCRLAARNFRTCRYGRPRPSLAPRHLKGSSAKLVLWKA